MRSFRTPGSAKGPSGEAGVPTLICKKMKTYSSLLLSLLLALPLSGGDLIPFDEFFVSVETNDWMNRRDEGTRLNVSVHVSRSAQEPNGSTSVEVDCFEFEAAQRMLPEADLKVFLAAGDAAQGGKEFRETVMTKTFRGEKETTYEVVEVDGKKMIRISRGEEKAEFLLVEAAKVRTALAQAKSGQAWFKKLLVDKTMPVPNEEARAPQAKGYYLNSSIGTVSGKGIGYEVSVSSHSIRQAPIYNIGHTLCLYSVDGELNGTLGGGWVAGMLQRISSALEAVNAGRAYSFTSGEDDGRRYSVTANLQTQEADVILIPGNFFKNRNSAKGSFGSAQLAGIRKLIDGCDERIKWFQANEHLFFTSTNEEAEQVMPPNGP